MVLTNSPRSRPRAPERRDAALPAAGSVRRRRWTGARVPIWFALPAVAVYLFVVIVPSVRGGVFAFTDWNGISPTFSFVGWDNFSQIWADPRAVGALANTAILAAVVMVFQNVFGLLLALALNTAVKSRNVLRVVFFAPVVLTPLVAGYIWSYMLAPAGGVNTFLRSIGLDALAQDWLGDPRFALGSVCVAIVWQFSGYSMVIYLAGLSAVPAEIIEASVVDGAGPVRRFFSITLPLINGAVVINLLLTLIGGLSQFDQVIAMTNGGPGTSTETISTVIYKVGFQLGDFPYGTALALIMTVVVAILAFLQYQITSKRVQS